MAANDDWKLRHRPKQARSRATWDAIVEAAAQILERRGAEGLNTSAVAERAGVSIGTLYQYFADKQALLLAAARRELEADAGASTASRRTVLIEALIAALERLADIGASATAAMGPTPTLSPRPRRRSGVDRRVAELLEAWLPAIIPRRGRPSSPFRSDPGSPADDHAL